MDENNLPVINNDNEIQTTKQAFEAVAEMKAVVYLAKEFPRNYNHCWGLLASACQRKSFASLVEYRYPRGDKQVAGPTVVVAREAAKLYGNMRWGLNIVKDEEDSMTIEGWAWDVENNVRSAFQDKFKKLIQRKVWENKKCIGTKWVVPDERDLRELTNRKGAILTRNALLSILPRDYIDDALALAKKTLKSEIKDPDGDIKHLIVEFQKIRVSVEMIDNYLGHAEWDLDDIVNLNNVLNAIKDGVAKKDHYFPRDNAEDNGRSATENLTDKLKAKVVNRTVKEVFDLVVEKESLLKPDSFDIYSQPNLKKLSQEELNLAYDKVLKEADDEEAHRDQTTKENVSA